MTDKGGRIYRCRHRDPIAGKTLRSFLWTVVVSCLAPNAMAQSSGYDPRTWRYDASHDVVIAPSDSGNDGREVSLHEWTPIPRQLVEFSEPQPLGSIIVDTSERRLYYVTGGGKALKYAIGVGKEGFEWTGRDRISGKRQWPDWRPPADMRRRTAAEGRILPARVEGGPNNPLGARALYIGSTLYRIHGTNQPWTIGEANSSGCIRMTNEDVIDLYNRVLVGATVTVRH